MPAPAGTLARGVAAVAAAAGEWIGAPRDQVGAMVASADGFYHCRNVHAERTAVLAVRFAGAREGAVRAGDERGQRRAGQSVGISARLFGHGRRVNFCSWVSKPARLLKLARWAGSPLPPGAQGDSVLLNDWSLRRKLRRRRR